MPVGPLVAVGTAGGMVSQFITGGPPFLTAAQQTNAGEDTMPFCQGLECCCMAWQLVAFQQTAMTSWAPQYLTSI